MSNPLVPGSESVFVPLGLARLATLVADGRLLGTLPAYGATPALVAWGEFGPDELEDATFVAQSLAGVAALADPDLPEDERRVVLAVPVSGFVEDADGAPGAGTVTGVAWRRVQAVFADEASLDVTAVRAAARGRTVTEAWDDDVVADFVEENDLGWFTPEEAERW